MSVYSILVRKLQSVMGTAVWNLSIQPFSEIIALWERTGHHYHSACAVLVLLWDSDSDSMDLLCDTMIVYLRMT